MVYAIKDSGMLVFHSFRPESLNLWLNGKNPASTYNSYGRSPQGLSEDESERNNIEVAREQVCRIKHKMTRLTPTVCLSPSLLVKALSQRVCFTLIAIVFTACQANNTAALADEHEAVATTSQAIPADALNAIKNDDWKQAATALDPYVKAEPGNAKGHFLLGKVLFNQRKYAGAKEELRKALRLGHGDSFSAKANDLLMQMPKNVVAPKKFQLAQAKIKGRKVAAAGLTRPRILSFSAKWADPCKQLQVDLDKAKIEFGEQVEIYTVDVDDPKNEQLINQYDVSPVPTVVFLNNPGKVVNFLIGYSDPTELERSIKKVLNKS